MKRYLIPYLACFLGSLCCYGQTRSLYVVEYSTAGVAYQNKNTYTISEEKLLLRFKEEQSPEDVASILATAGLRISSEYITNLGDDLSFVCPLPARLTHTIEDYISSLTREATVKSVSYFLTSGGSAQAFAPLHELFAAPAEGTTEEMVATAIAPYEGVILDIRDNGTYKFEIGGAFDPANVSVSLYEGGLFRFCEPDMLLFMTPSADHSSDQWYVNSNNALADTEIDDVWNSSNLKKGDNIVIAVVDDGVRTSHPDLSNRIYGGYDEVGPSIAMTGLAGSDSEDRDNGHGTSIAGILVGENNSDGVKGIAYNAKVLPIRVGYNAFFWSTTQGAWEVEYVTTNQWLADGIYHARTSADIINCSWGGGAPSNLISDEIYSAVDVGRGGLGTPVLFATGNNDNSTVSFPGNHPAVIAVGATKENDQRKILNPAIPNDWGSNYGQTIDVVAPGVNISTTDITGVSLSGSDWDLDGDALEDLGYNGGDVSGTDYSDPAYTRYFGGTSAACPVAAGVMALILSNVPGLTEQQAREMLETTCDKPSNYTFAVNGAHPNGDWNIEMGYGRVNAMNAVLAAIATYGGGSVTANSNDPTFISTSVGNNVCYNENYPPYIAWEAETDFPFHNGTDYFISNALVELSNTSVFFDIHAFVYGFPVASFGVGDYTGTNDASIEFYTEPPFPVTLNTEIQLGSNNPFSNNNFVNTTQINWTIDGVNLDFFDYQEYVCMGNSHTLTADIGGSFPPYTYTYQRLVAGNWVDLAPAQTVPSAQTVQHVLSPSEYLPGTNYYRITVSNDAECSRTSSTKEIYVSNLQATNLNFDACIDGLEIPLNVASGGLPPYTYNWSPSTFINNPSGTTVATFQASNPNLVPGIHFYTVDVADAAGCTQTLSVNIDVHAPGSTATPLINVNPDPVCFGGYVVLTGVFGAGSTPPYTYQWSDNLGNVLNSSPTNDPYIVYNFDAGSADFTFTIIDGHNCTNSSSATVTNSVLAGPIIASELPQSVCPGKDVIIDPYIILPGGSSSLSSITYDWSNGSTNSEITVSELVNTAYTLTITDINGCYHSETFEIIRDPALGPQINFNYDNQGTFCSGQSAIISSNVSGGTSPYTYNWSPTGDITPTISTTVTPVDLTVTDVEGCVSSDSYSIAFPPAVQVLMDPPHPSLPDPPFSISNPMCAGDVFNFQTEYNNVGGYITGGTAPYTVEYFVKYNWVEPGDWSFSYTEISNGAIPPTISHPIAPLSIGAPVDAVITWASIRMEVTDANGCFLNTDWTVSLQQGAHNLDASFTYDVKPCTTPNLMQACFQFQPFVGISTSTTITITSLFPGGSQVPVYNEVGGYSSYCVYLKPGGDYQVTITQSDDCTSDTYSQIISVNGPPSGTNIPINHNVCSGPPGPPAAYYLASNKVYNSCPVNIIGSGLTSYYAGYEVLLNPGFTAYYGTNFIADISPCLINGGRQAGPTNEFSAEQQPVLRSEIYPNPNNGLFTIKLNASEEPTQVSIFTLQGVSVWTKQLNTTSHNVQLEGLKPGIYLVSFVRGEQREMEKLMIE